MADDDSEMHGELIDTTIPRRMPEFVIGAGFLLIFVCLTTLQVVTRYVLNSPLQWTEELASYLLIWMIFIGAIGVHRYDTHLRVEMLDEWAPAWIVAFIRIIYDFVIFFVLLLLVKSGWDLYQSMRFDKLPALRWPIRYLIAIVPVASLVMAVYSLWHMSKRYKFLTGKSDTQIGGPQ